MKHTNNALQLIKQKPVQFFIGVGIFILTLVVLLTTTAKIRTKSYAAVSSLKIFKFPTKKNSSPQIKKETKHEYYTLKEGESLWDVAQKVYNNPYKYVQIIELNKITTADTLEKGTKLLVK